MDGINLGDFELNDKKGSDNLGSISEGDIFSLESSSGPNISRNLERKPEKQEGAEATQEKDKVPISKQKTFKSDDPLETVNYAEKREALIKKINNQPSTSNHRKDLYADFAAKSDGQFRLGPNFQDLDALDPQKDNQGYTHDNAEDDDTNEDHPLDRNLIRLPDNDSEYPVSLYASVQPVTEQPGSNFSIFQFDPMSKVILETLDVEHRSHRQLRSVINRELLMITQEAEGKSQTLTGPVTYNQFLREILFENEEIQMGKRHLKVSSVVFDILQEAVIDSAMSGTRARTFGIKSPKRPPFLTGRIYITNHRLLLLSAEKHRGASVKPMSEENPRYRLQAVNKDNLQFLGIPLNQVRGVELFASSGFTANAILGSKTICCGLFSRLTTCLPDELTSRSWRAIDRSTYSASQRIITLGVLLPPWFHPTNLLIHIEGDVGMKVIRDFISELQKCSPSLKTQMQGSSSED